MIMWMLGSSRADTFPNTVLEALACGTPLAATSAGGIPEQAGDAGLLFDPKNKEDMAEKIYRIWIDEDLRKQLIQKGYGKIKGMTLENYARQWQKTSLKPCFFCQRAMIEKVKVDLGLTQK